MTMFRYLAAGAAGALTTNALHEVIRRIVPGAPRVDLLGMQALAKMYRAAGSDAPTGKRLYVRTLIGDLISNSAYFSLVGIVPRGTRVGAGVALGFVAGFGAVLLPPKLRLSGEPTARTALTSALTVAIYAAGGTVAGMLASSAADAADDHEPQP